MEVLVSLMLVILALASIAFSQLVFKKQMEYFFESQSKMFLKTDETKEIFAKQITAVEIEHFRSLDRITAKMLGELEKQQKTYLCKLQEMLEMMSAGGVANYYDIKHPSKKIKDVIENEIEKKETDEIQLTDNIRIPITSETKVKFEDEEEILAPGNDE